MKLKYTSLALGASAALAASSNAALVQWQAEVGNGTSAASSLFSTVSTPQEFNVGSLTASRTFEFIVNAGLGGGSSALLGDSILGGPRQGLKFEQSADTGRYGITNFGVADFTSTAAATINTDIHLAFVFDGTDTVIYENGISVATMASVSLTLTDTVGLGGARNATAPAGFFDVMDGDILGFASYDSALSGAEITAHSDAFAVPEPSSTALLGLGGLALIMRRRK
ncbi:MAG: LamG-like jellyroll fold domain-containing protein [Akkermansiaceae bacterium]